MTANRNFWIAACAVIALIYAAAIAFAAQYGLAHKVVRLALIMLAVHLLEIPLAFKRLAGKSAQPARVAVLTLVFGAAWWLPAQRGLFPVR